MPRFLVKFALFSVKLVCWGELEEKGRITGLAFITEEVAKVKIKQGIGNHFVELKNINRFSFWGEMQ